MTTYQDKINLLNNIHSTVDVQAKKIQVAWSGETRFGTMVRTSNKQNIGFSSIASNSPIAFATKSFD